MKRKKRNHGKKRKRRSNLERLVMTARISTKWKCLSASYQKSSQGLLDTKS